MSRTYLDVPMATLRAVHSGWIDYLDSQHPAIWDAHVKRVGGIDFRRWSLALVEGRYILHRRIDPETDDVYVGIAVPVTDSAPWVLFELLGRHAAIDATYLLTASMLGFDETLASLLDGSAE